MTAPDVGVIRFRRPTESDHTPIVRVVDEWWGGRRMSGLFLRLWFQHFAGTSWVAEDEDGRLLGFLFGFISQDDPEVGYVHMIATNPNLRRHGLGAQLYGRFFDDVAARGVRRVMAIDAEHAGATPDQVKRRRAARGSETGNDDVVGHKRKLAYAHAYIDGSARRARYRLRRITHSHAGVGDNGGDHGRRSASPSLHYRARLDAGS